MALFPNQMELNEVMVVSNDMVFGTMDKDGSRTYYISEKPLIEEAHGGMDSKTIEEIGRLPVRGTASVIATTNGLQLLTLMECQSRQTKCQFPKQLN